MVLARRRLGPNTCHAKFPQYLRKRDGLLAQSRADRSRFVWYISYLSRRTRPMRRDHIRDGGETSPCAIGLISDLRACHLGPPANLSSAKKTNVTSESPITDTKTGKTSSNRTKANASPRIVFFAHRLFYFSAIATSIGLFILDVTIAV